MSVCLFGIVSLLPEGGICDQFSTDQREFCDKLSMLVITDMNDSGSRQRISLGEAFVANTLQIVSKTSGAPLYV